MSAYQKDTLINARHKLPAGVMTGVVGLVNTVPHTISFETDVLPCSDYCGLSKVQKRAAPQRRREEGAVPPHLSCGGNSAGIGEIPLPSSPAPTDCWMR